MVLGALLASLALGAPPPAPASAAEVHFDPDSPAGKEYALPLPQARSEAVGGEGIGDRAPSEAPLFGAGVTSEGEEGEAAGAGSPDRGTGGGAATGGEGSTGQGETGRQASGTAAPGQPSAANETGRSSFSLGGAIALVAAALLAAVILGFALRAVSRLLERRAQGHHA